MQDSIIDPSYLDFEKTRRSLKFQNGILNVIKGIKTGNQVIMCTEKYSIECHRAIMVSLASTSMCQYIAPSIWGTILYHDSSMHKFMPKEQRPP